MIKLHQHGTETCSNNSCLDLKKKWAIETAQHEIVRLNTHWIYMIYKNPYG